MRLPARSGPSATLTRAAVVLTLNNFTQDLNDLRAPLHAGPTSLAAIFYGWTHGVPQLAWAAYLVMLPSRLELHIRSMQYYLEHLSAPGASLRRGFLLA